MTTAMHAGDTRLYTELLEKYRELLNEFIIVSNLSFSQFLLKMLITVSPGSALL